MTKTHECVQGPLCETMEQFILANSACEDPYCAMYGCYCPDPQEEECYHWSCQAIIHQPCEACFIETMDAVYAEEGMA